MVNFEKWSTEEYTITNKRVNNLKFGARKSVNLGGFTVLLHIREQWCMLQWKTDFVICSKDPRGEALQDQKSEHHHFNFYGI